MRTDVNGMGQGTDERTWTLLLCTRGLVELVWIDVFHLPARDFQLTEPLLQSKKVVHH